jgi:peptide/nickel transport system permease protein
VSTLQLPAGFGPEALPAASVAVAPLVPGKDEDASPAGGLRARVRRHPTIFIGGLMLLVIVLLALFAPWVGTVDPQAIAPVKRLRPPGAENWLGTDMLGRDVYSRVIYGARVSLTIGLGVAVLAAVLGLVIGMVTGFLRAVDAVVMRVMDGLMAIPSVLLAIALMALTRASVQNVVIAITIAEIPRVVRLVRGVVLTLRDQPFVEAAVASGTRFVPMLWRHILPNTFAPVLVQATYICASAMLVEATLSFIGAGTPPSTPSWGNIMAEGRTIFQLAPSVILFPGILLSLTVLAVNLLGDGLRDALDPRLSRLM